MLDVIDLVRANSSSQIMQNKFEAADFMLELPEPALVRRISENTVIHVPQLTLTIYNNEAEVVKLGQEEVKM